MLPVSFHEQLLVLLLKGRVLFMALPRTHSRHMYALRFFCRV